MKSISFHAVEGIPLIKAGDNLAELVALIKRVLQSGRVVSVIQSLVARAFEAGQERAARGGKVAPEGEPGPPADGTRAG